MSNKTSEPSWPTNPRASWLTGDSIIRLLRQVVAQTGVTIVVASHDPNVHEAADLIFGLQDGRLVEREALRGEELFKPPGRRGVGMGSK